MGKNKTKKKGRQSDGFECKSLRAYHQMEIKEQQQETLKWTRKETLDSLANQQYQMKQRPCFKIDSITSLRHFMRERKSEDSYILRERRKRNGFIPPTMNSSNAFYLTSSSSSHHQKEIMDEGLIHPPGWIVRYEHHTHHHINANDTIDNNQKVDNNNNISKLQDLSLLVFANYIREYQHDMGREKLHTIVSLLSSNCLMELSILLCSNSKSNNNGISSNSEYYMNDDIAMLVGAHPHVERLCLRAGAGTGTGTGTGTDSKNKNSQRNTITDRGIEELIPTFISSANKNKNNHNHNQSKFVEAGDTKSHIGDGNENEQEQEHEHVLDCWEDQDDDEYDDHDDDHDHDDKYDSDRIQNSSTNSGDGGATIANGSGGFKLQGCNIKLRRLELLDLGSFSCDKSHDDDIIRNRNSISSATILRWLEKCSGITHLSLAGSFSATLSASSSRHYHSHHQYAAASMGREIVLALPNVLPNLQVLDLTRCSWVTDSLLSRMMEGYYHNNTTTINNNNSTSPTTTTTTNSSSTLLSSLPIVYYHRGRFSFSLNQMKRQHQLQLNNNINNNNVVQQQVEEEDTWW